MCFSPQSVLNLTLVNG